MMMLRTYNAIIGAAKIEWLKLWWDNLECLVIDQGERWRFGA